MIYIIDHNDSFTQNVVHQFSLFGKVEYDNFNQINYNKLEKASIIVFSPGPGSPKDYPITSNVYKKFKKKKKIIAIKKIAIDIIKISGDIKFLFMFIDKKFMDGQKEIVKRIKNVFKKNLSAINIETFVVLSFCYFFYQNNT